MGNIQPFGEVKDDGRQNLCRSCYAQRYDPEYPPQYSVTASFGNKTDTTLTVQFTIKMYGVSVEEQENYKITTESLKKGKVGVPYSDKITFGKQ